MKSLFGLIVMFCFWYLVVTYWQDGEVGVRGVIVDTGKSILSIVDDVKKDEPVKIEKPVVKKKESSSVIVIRED